jgi:hypothetical protein
MAGKIDLNKTTFADLFARVQSTSTITFQKNRLKGDNQCQLNQSTYNRPRLICQTTPLRQNSSTFRAKEAPWLFQHRE